MVGCDRMSTWGSEGGQPDNWIDREIRAGQTRNESSLGPGNLEINMVENVSHSVGNMGRAR